MKTLVTALVFVSVASVALTMPFCGCPGFGLDQGYEHGHNHGHNHGHDHAHAPEYYGPRIYGGEDPVTDPIRIPPPSYKFGYLGGGAGCMRNVHMGSDGMDVTSGAGAFGYAGCGAGSGYCHQNDRPT